MECKARELYEQIREGNEDIMPQWEHLAERQKCNWVVLADRIEGIEFERDESQRILGRVVVQNEGAIIPV